MESAWKPLESNVTDVDRKSKKLKTEEDEALKKFKETKEHGDHLVNNLEGRKRWLEFLSAIDECLPKDQDDKDGRCRSTTDPDALKTAIMHRNQLLVTNLDSQQVDDVGKWFAAVKPWYLPVRRLAGSAAPGRCFVRHGRSAGAAAGGRGGPLRAGADRANLRPTLP